MKHSMNIKSIRLRINSISLAFHMETKAGSADTKSGHNCTTSVIMRLHGVCHDVKCLRKTQQNPT